MTLKSGKLVALTILGLLSLTTSNAVAASAAGGAGGGGGSNCTKLSDDAYKAVDKARGAPSGGWNDANAGKVSPEVQAANTAIEAVKNAGCEFDNRFAPKFDRGEGSLINSQLSPAAPGDKVQANDPTYDKNFSLPFADLSKLLPVDSNTTYDTPKYETPHKDDAVTAANQCGQLASDYTNFLRGITGANRPVFKEGCAGTDVTGKPQSSLDFPSTSCKGNEIGKFGLIELAYNNNKQTVNVSSLLNHTPGNVTEEGSVTFFNSKTGAKPTKSTCSLSGYGACGKAGDIILVQTKPTATSIDGFDTYLIYDGKGNFYEMINSSSQPIRYGPADPAYNSASYAAIRMGCASSGSNTGTGSK